MTPYSFETNGRNRKTLFALIAVWALILLAIAFLDAALWLMALIAFCTAPALYDLLAGRRAGVGLSDAGLSWFAGRRTGDITWDRISHMRLDTRLDFSVRATAVLSTGRKIRLPFEATPPHRDFEQALEARCIPVKRFHFQLMQ